MQAKFAVGILLLVLVVAAGCAGQQAEKPAPSPGNQANAPAPKTNEASNPPKAAPAPTPSVPAPKSPDFLSEWRRLAAQQAPEYRLQTRMTFTSSEGDSESLVEEYVKGGKRRRMDMKLDLGGSFSNLRTFYLLSDETVTCTAGEGTELCLKSAEKEDFKQFDAQVQEAKVTQDEFSLAKDSPRTLAGQTAECYKATGVTDGGAQSTMTFCYTSDGIPLYMQVESRESSMEMKAERLERTVSDADLVPPPAQDLGDLYGGAGGFDPEAYKDLVDQYGQQPQ